MWRTYAIVLVLVALAASWLGRVPLRASSSNDMIVVPGPSGRASAASDSASDNPQKIDQLNSAIELTRDENGYFFADVQINGAPVHMLVDTGATVIALSRNDAQMAGIATPIGMNDVVGEGADGEVKGVQIRLDRVVLGDKSVENLPAIVLNRGGQSLLGQSFLSQFASVKIEGDKMILR